MSHIFISYSRRDLDFAQKIVDALAAKDLDTWIDWKSIPKGEDWQQEIYRGIEEADAFLFLVSLDSVTSGPCNGEIAHAVKNGKRILPIFIANVDDRGIYGVTEKFPHEDQKKEISRLNFIKCREGRDDFDGAIEEIRRTIHTDYEWLKFHTELQVKALKWEQKKDNSRLLRGKELQDAEQQFANAGNQKDPQPTISQRQYLLKSRQYADSIKKTITWSSIGVAVIMVLLAVVSLRNAIDAKAQKENIHNLYLTDNANKMFDDHNPDLGLALALYANRKHPIQSGLWMEKFSRELISRQNSDSLSETPYNALIDATYLSLSTNSHKVCGDGWAFSADISSDDKFVVVACNNPQKESGEIVLFETKSEPEIKRINVDYWVYSVAFSPDSKTILSGDSGKRAALWDLNGKQLKVFNGHTDAVHSVGFDPQGKLIVTTSFDQNVIVWDASTKQELYRKKDLYSLVLTAAFHPSLPQVVFGDNDGNIAVWDFKTGTVEYAYGIHSGAVLSIAYAPSGNFFASGGADGKIALWQIHKNTPQKFQELTGQGGWIYSLGFLSNGTELISGASDRSLVLWDLASGEIRQRMDGHMDEVQSIAVDARTNIVVSAARDGTVRVWDLSPLYESASGNAPYDGEMLHILPVDNNNQIMITTSSQGRLQIWSRNQEITHSNFDMFDSPLTGLAKYPDGLRILIGTQAGDLLVENIQTKEREMVFTERKGTIRDVAVSPDGKLSAAAFMDATIKVWDTGTGQPLCILAGHTNIVNSIAFVPSRKYSLISGSNDHTAMEWNLETCKNEVVISPTRVFTGHDFWVMDVAVSPDGKYFATASGDQTVILWGLESGDQVYRVRLSRINPDPRKELYMLSVAFSPDGKTLLSGSATGDILLWSVSSGKLLRHFIQKQDENCILRDRCRWAWDVAFSPDGNMAYASFADGSWHAWDLIQAHDIKSLAEWISENRYVHSFTEQEIKLYEINQ
jgi:WD40 repeat protein